MAEEAHGKEEIKDPRAQIAKDLTVQILGRLEGLVVAELDEAGEVIGNLYRTIYRAVDETMTEAEARAGARAR